jgi:hypothetical protein
VEVSEKTKLAHKDKAGIRLTKEVEGVTRADYPITITPHPEKQEDFDSRIYVQSQRDYLTLISNLV